MHHPLTSSDRYTPSGQTRRIFRLSGSPPRKLLWHAVAAGLLLALAAPQALAAISEWKASSNRILISGGGTITLSEIRATTPNLPDGALVRVSTIPSVWLLGVDIDIIGNTRLDIVNEELRLKSDPPVVTSPDFLDYVVVTVEHGHIYVSNAKAVSWDTTVADCATVGATDRTDCFDMTADLASGRAHLRARSKDADPTLGTPVTESRMDIVGSEIAYLGFTSSEAYGLSWKVNDSSGNPNPPDLLERVNVYGDVMNSNVHHNMFGIYSFGLQDGKWVGNNIHENIGYGLDAHDDSDNLVIENNTVNNNGSDGIEHGIILSKRCDHAVIRSNTANGNFGNGIMLHVLSDDAIVENNTANDNGDAGIALYCSHRNLIKGNAVIGNKLYGVRLTVASVGNAVEDNLIQNSGTAGVSGYGVYLQPATDTNGSCGDANLTVRDNTFTGNVVEGSVTTGLKIKDSHNNRFVGNTVSDGVSVSNAVSPETQLTQFSGNTFGAGSIVRLDGDVNFPLQADFTDSPRVGLQILTGAVARFTDDAGAIFDLIRDIYVQVTGSNSLLDLTAANAGTATVTVETRALNVRTDGSVANVAPTLWETSGDYRKAWLTQAANPSGSLQHTVGDLQPGVSYDVKRGDATVGAFAADSAGGISFADATGTTNAVTYTVTKSAAQPQTGGGGGGSDGGGALDLTLLALLAGILALKRRAVA